MIDFIYPLNTQIHMRKAMKFLSGMIMLLLACSCIGNAPSSDSIVSSDSVTNSDSVVKKSLIEN